MFHPEPGHFGWKAEAASSIAARSIPQTPPPAQTGLGRAAHLAALERLVRDRLNHALVKGRIKEQQDVDRGSWWGGTRTNKAIFECNEIFRWAYSEPKR